VFKKKPRNRRSAQGCRMARIESEGGASATCFGDYTPSLSLNFARQPALLISRLTMLSVLAQGPAVVQARDANLDSRLSLATSRCGVCNIMTAF
jgi:hypothetical protein